MVAAVHAVVHGSLILGHPLHVQEVAGRLVFPAFLVVDAFVLLVLASQPSRRITAMGSALLLLPHFLRAADLEAWWPAWQWTFMTAGVLALASMRRAGGRLADPRWLGLQRRAPFTIPHAPVRTEHP